MRFDVIAGGLMVAGTLLGTTLYIHNKSKPSSMDRIADALDNWPAQFGAEMESIFEGSVRGPTFPFADLRYYPVWPWICTGSVLET